MKWSPQRFFIPRALLFGEAAAVYGFNRVSRFINVILCRGADLVVTGYYDDFSQLETKRLSLSAEATFKRVFDALGFDLSVEESKDKRFDNIFHPLGVELDLSYSIYGAVHLKPKAGRVQRVMAVSSEVLVKEEMSVKEARTLSGVLRFLREGHFGRTGAAVLKSLSDHANASSDLVIDSRLKEGLEWLLCFLPVAPPRIINAHHAGSVVSIFTDGAVDAECVTVGAIIFEDGFAPEVFGERVPQGIEARWRESGSEQVVGQAELLPVVLATLIWKKRLANRYVLWWLDNDAARQGLINGYSRSARRAQVIDDALMLMSFNSIYSWFGRVPSPCNPADMPSRLEWQKLSTLVPDAVRLRIGEGVWARV